MGMFDRFRQQQHGNDPQEYEGQEEAQEQQYDPAQMGAPDETPQEDPQQGEPEQAQPEEAERTDWKAKAIEYQTRLELMAEQQQQAQYQQQPEEPDEVQVLEQRLQEAREAIPQIDPNDPQTFWQREQAKEKVEGIREELYQARERRLQYNVMEQQSQTVLQQYKMQFQQSPVFQAVEQRFDQLVGQMAPHLRQNPAMLEMIRKNVEYDYMQQNQGGRQVPPKAPGGEYNNQRPPKQKGATFQSDNDRQVAEFYGMTAEEFYDPKYREHPEVTNGNGVLIYDVPESKGRRRFRG